MASRNYGIIRSEVPFPGGFRFFWRDSAGVQPDSEPIDAIIDYDEFDDVFRIELVFFQSRLREIRQSIEAPEPLVGDEYFFQVGTDNPVSLIIKTQKAFSEIARHVYGVAFALEDVDGVVCGIEVIIDQ